MELFWIGALVFLAFMVAMMIMMFRHGCMPAAKRARCCGGTQGESPKPQC
jgi:hypothetical protein